MIHEPVFIIGAPRSGTSILFRSLSMHADLWHLPRESHSVFEGPFHPDCGFESNRVTDADVTDSITQNIHDGFENRVLNLGVLKVDQQKWLTDRALYERVRNRIAIKLLTSQSRAHLPTSFRLLEKTPKNSLRVSALAAMFPGARFVYLERDAAQNIDSLLAGWRAFDKLGPFKRHRFCSAGYAIARELRLFDYEGTHWKFALVPEWRRLRGQSCADVAAAQYFQCNSIAKEDLRRLPGERVFAVTYDAFVDDPVHAVREIFDWAELPPSEAAEEFAANMPRVNDATPQWKRNAGELRFADEVEAAMDRWDAGRAAA